MQEYRFCPNLLDFAFWPAAECSRCCYRGNFKPLSKLTTARSPGPFIQFFLEVMMSQKETNFFNIDAMEQGIARTLVEGITTRIFPGDQAMLSVVRIAPNAVGAIHSHP